VDPPKVRTTTERIFALFADFTSAIEAYSIDEAFLDLTGFCADLRAAEETALRIKRRIKDEVGEWLRCSIGIAPTRWLAKFAGEMQKPDGLTILRKEDLPRVYAGRPVDEAWGIAEGWKARLAAMGIRTLDQLLVADPNELKRRFGIPGYLLWANIAGLDAEPVKPTEEAAPKSVGHSYVFHRRTDDERQIGAIMMKLSERVGRRLRRKGLEARRVSASWGYREGGDWGGVRCFEPIFESFDIFNAAWRAFVDSWDHEVVTSMAITASDLSPTMNQTSIFADRHRRQRIAKALDAVNDHYGDYTVIRGQMWGTAGSAPNRVGFRQTVAVVPNGENISVSDE
jgi:DNA polymerase-4